MRLGFLLLTCAGLSACATAPSSPNTATVPTAPFAAPMDPAQIRCADLTHPTALSIGTDWALGRARAALISGRLSVAPANAQMSQNLVTYCGQNPTATLGGAVTQLGI